jgi:cytochrome c-type biogenesis protein CcmH/NrfG
MQRIGDEIHLDDDEARGGATPHIVRYVLIVSLVLVVLAMSTIWIARAISEQPSRGQPVTAEQHALGG